ncbi:MAG: TIM barrel protein [Candidatus Aminicenantaceae bacterium]
MNTGADRLLFGTAGVPHSSPGASSLAGIKHIAQLGLDCMEVEFVKGVKMGGDTAKKIAESAQKLGIRLSVHAPYYINLNSPDKGKWLVSQERILNSARLAALCGAKNVVFHCGYYGEGSPEDAFLKIKKGIEEIVSILKSERTPVSLRAETMGKKSQFGSLEEILFLCREIDGLLPCIDFSHLHAREGKVNSYLEFYRILTKISRKLGKESLSDLHIHISGVEYSAKGEIRHLNLKESDFKYDEWIQALKDLDVKGMVICESPIQEHDAVMLKNLHYC